MIDLWTVAKQFRGNMLQNLCNNSFIDGMDFTLLEKTMVYEEVLNNSLTSLHPPILSDQKKPCWVALKIIFLINPAKYPVLGKKCVLEAFYEIFNGKNPLIVS